MNAIAYTLLSCYKHIDSIINNVNSHIRGCVNSGYYINYYEDEMRIFTKIIKYNTRKRRLNIMKYIVDAILYDCDPLTRNILTLKYIDCSSFEDIKNKYNKSARTIFRYIDKCKIKFVDVMKQLNFTEEMLMSYFEEEPLFISILNHIKKEVKE